MQNLFNLLMRRHEKAEGQRDIDLADVVPEHPDEYPARRLKERLDRRREAFEEIEGGHKGLPEGPGGF